MMRYVLLAAIFFSFAGCDPAYHLQYAVVNDCDQPVYCVDKNKKGPDAVIRIEPDSAVVLYEESGFGYGKPQFKESKPEVANRFAVYADSTLSDSSRIIPRKGWKYYALPIDDYNARLYIRRRDLKK